MGTPPAVCFLHGCVSLCPSSRRACFHPISHSPHREKKLLTSMYGFEDLAPAMKYCGSKSVRSSTSKRTYSLVTAVSGAIFMPLGHLPKVTLHEGPQHKATTDSHSCPPESREPFQTFLVCSISHISFPLCECIHIELMREVREATAQHICSHAYSFFFVTLLKYIPAPYPA